MMQWSRPRFAAAAALVAGVLLLPACAPDPAVSPAPTRPSPVETEAIDPSATPSPSPSASAAAAEIPDDCRTMLSDAVLSQLADTPLNPENAGPVGVQSDGSLICLWRDPGADTTFLSTTIEAKPRGEALDMMNGVASQHPEISCYTPDGGTRCDGTWPNPDYPVTDGRTLFWRDGILIDTSFSNLAPTGYTDSIVAHIFGD
jgi:hypothetical protein